MNSGRINFRDRKPIDKTPAIYDPLDKKIDVSDLHRSHNKDIYNYKLLGWIVFGYTVVMVLIYVIAYLMLEYGN